MKIPVIFSTVTGNAFKLASAVSQEIQEGLGPYNIFYMNNDEVINLFDTFVLVYWCNHATADDETINFISKLKNKKVIILGTLGAAPDSDHGKKVLSNVEALVTKENALLGNFLCRGAIDLNRTRRRMSIPEGEKGHLSAERFEKQKESLNHPNEEDFNNARAFIKEVLTKNGLC